MATTVRLDLSEFQVKLAVLKRPQRPLARALNRSIDSGKTMAGRLVGQDMGLAVGIVKDFLTVARASEARLEATLSASPERVPLIRFRARGPEPSRRRPGGVTAALKGGAGRYPHAFIATMRSGHRGVFARRGRSRGPIAELRGPSIWQSYQRVEPQVRARVSEQLAKNVASEIAFEFSR